MMQADDKQQFNPEKWEEDRLRLLVYARYWAETHYKWSHGQLLRNGIDLDDLVCEVFADYSRGIRHFNDKHSEWVQMKGTVRSKLWNLHSSKENRTTGTEDSEFFGSIEDKNPGPEVALHSEAFCERFFVLLYSDQRLKTNNDLRKLVDAIKNGAMTVGELAEEAGLTHPRVSEVRRQLKPIATSVLRQMNREGDGNE